MKHYQLANHEVQGAITVLTMRPVSPSDRMEYRAGQYVAVGFTRFGRRTPMRCFSMVNAPNSDGELQIAFRRQGNFTDALSDLQVGGKVYLSGPFGQFTVPSTQQYPLVYLAAGIGITPFMALLHDQAKRGPQVPTTLLYSCRSLEDAPFASELLSLQQQCPWLKVRLLVDQVPASFQNHPLVLNQKIDAGVFESFCSPDADYYVCGPTGYTARVHELLAEQGVSEDQYHSESFTQGSKLGIAGFALQKLVYSLVAVALVVGIGGVYTLDAIKAKEKTQGTTAATQTVPTTQSTSSGDDGGSTATNNQATTNTNNSYYTQPVSRVS